MTCEAGSATLFTAAFDQASGRGTYVGMEAFEGSVDGRAGTFAYVHSATTSGADRTHEFFLVVPGSGTGELAGIRGGGSMAVEADGIHRVTGAVIGDGSLFDGRVGPPSTGFAPDVPDLGGQLSALTYDHGTALKHYTPATFAAHQLVMTMRGMGIQAKAAPRTVKAPAAGRLLGIVSSPPMATMPSQPSSR